ncbi:E-selectin-like [Kryptolebias marmoratus]|uniref:E-selectin-like n=1 Tax=Kryptolebias marmoratus TaxID=37003 RepID=UPI0007F8C16E|nr:E-selectin-like [Kryptolebias marmoratus]
MSSSWTCIIFLCSMLCTWTSVECWSYFYSNDTMNWETARAWCKNHYTDMVAIQNRAEIEHLSSWLPRKATYYWIGIRKVENVWTWVGTNKSLTAEATNWAVGEPNNGKDGNNGKKKHNAEKSEDCVEMYIKRESQAGKWNDEWCMKKKTALCFSAACKHDSCLYGECVETINSHRCECTPGFYGEKCQHVHKCDKDEVIAPPKGSVSCTSMYGDFAYNCSCQYSCEEGYELSTPGPQRCNETGKWTKTSPTCELVQCRSLIAPPNGSLLKSSDPLGLSSYRSTRVFTCDEGYEMDELSSDTLQCESSGDWNASRPSCVAVQCSALQDLENGFVSCEDQSKMRFSYKKSCSFSCDAGYRLVGPSRVTCTSAAEWSEKIPHCEAITCQKPEAGAQMIILCSESELHPNSTCSFSCEPGFELQGTNTVKCSEEGRWNETMPSCKAVQCPALQHPDHGILSCVDDAEMRFTYGKTCSFSCAPGYRLVGPSRLTCTAAADWSEQIPRCEAIICKFPETEAQVITECNKPLTELGLNSTCSFSCEPGFELQGANTTTCTENGLWNEATPTCEAVRCPLLMAPEHGHINCSNHEPVFNSQCFFTCDQDYSLKGHKMLICGHHGNWTGKNPTCQALSPSTTVIATSVAAAGTALASGLSLAMWILKRLRQKASKFELNSNSDIEEPPQVYKNSIDSLL